MGDVIAWIEQHTVHMQQQQQQQSAISKKQSENTTIEDHTDHRHIACEEKPNKEECQPIGFLLFFMSCESGNKEIK